MCYHRTQYGPFVLKFIENYLKQLSELNSSACLSKHAESAVAHKSKVLEMLKARTAS